MNAMRLLAKLTAKGMQIVGAGGGVVEVSRTDVAAAIAFAGVSVTADRLIRFLYCADHAQAPLLVPALVHEVRNLVTADRAMRYKLVQLALVEVTGRKHCRACNGHGVLAAKDCGVCGGAGLRAASQRDRAALLGVPDTTFRRNHETDADTVYQYVSQMQQDALSKLAAQFIDLAA